MKNFIAGAILVATLAVSGTAFAAELVIKGSTTVLPIAQSAAEKYMTAHPEVAITVSGGGSGNGIKAIIDGTTDIADSSRFIKNEEVKAAVEKGTYPVPFGIAMDALIPVVHPSNPVQDLSIEQLKKIYMGEIKNWKDVGGSNKPIAIVSRDTSSGTYETWESKILQGERVDKRALIVASNGAMVQTVAKNENAVGYIGLGYLNDSVKALKVEGISGNKENALNGTFPVSRYLYMFTKEWPSGDILNFINFVLSDEGQKLVGEAGFVPIR
ncbi:phosphate ABC transporter substrate-binding protein [Aminobacterium sp. EBM-42]|jgi:phosphate transport system substrate-binding protein|uniref:phosphate ABC transporter substrate-binding protein n=1 Tax=Aminobacterium sp. EBM-42 TaxID=1918503 RepID=UPI000A77D4C3|nr:phosphate ABC transporter substrate-binding protein [Aminobacterium sp. EBM-42]MDD3768602.1 phosphate ABC transporter substrate-binding protein [Aminobacterium colombiense]